MVEIMAPLQCCKSRFVERLLDMKNKCFGGDMAMLVVTTHFKYKLIFGAILGIAWWLPASMIVLSFRC